MYLDVASKPVIKRLSKFFKIISISTIALIVGLCIILLKVVDVASSSFLGHFMESGLIMSSFVIVLTILLLAVILISCLLMWRAYRIHKQLDMLLETGDAEMLPLFFRNLTHVLLYFLLYVLFFLAIGAMLIFLFMR